MSAPREPSAHPAEPALPRVFLIAVQSVDGYITRGDQPGTAFASSADQKWFQEALGDMDAVIMGSGTYRASRDAVRSRLSPDRPRFVCTRSPRAYADDAVPDALTFTRASPTDLIASIAHSGRRRVGLVGGGETNARFLHEGCIDEIWLTIEPLVFGGGTPLAIGGPSLPLRLLHHEFLNTETLLLRYEVGDAG